MAGIDRRQAVSIHMSLMEIIQVVSDGNPGALTVLLGIIQHYGIGMGFPVILTLDDMNLRGDMLWIAYKDVCGSDVTRLMFEAAQNPDDLAKAVNEAMPADYYMYHAVASGASFSRQEVKS